MINSPSIFCRIPDIPENLLGAALNLKPPLTGTASVFGHPVHPARDKRDLRLLVIYDDPIANIRKPTRNSKLYLPIQTQEKLQGKY